MEPPRVEAIYAVSDCAGFVGAYPSADAAAELADKYPTIAFVAHKFPAAPGPCDSVWVIPFRVTDAVAFVSNDRAEADRVRNTYARIGLAYLDDIDCWEQPFGVLSKHAAQRLDAQHRAHQLHGVTDEELRRADETDMLRAESLSEPKWRTAREHKRVSIVDCVVPIGLNEATDRGECQDPASERQDPASERQSECLDPASECQSECPDAVASECQGECPDAVASECQE